MAAPDQARQMLEQQLSELKKSFRQFDYHDDGTVLPADMPSLLGSNGFEPKQETLQRIITDLELADAKFLYFEEFLLVLNRLLPVETDVELEEVENRCLFDIFDRSNSGYVTAPDIRNIASLLGLDMTTAAAEDMVAEADKDGDGRVDVEDFLILMKA